MAEQSKPLTTDDVRKGYAGSRVRHAHYDGGKEEYDYGVERFDAWLAAHDRQVAERIAQAIEAHAARLIELRDEETESEGYRQRIAQYATATHLASVARADSLAPRPAVPGVSVSAEQVEAAAKALRHHLHGHPSNGSEDDHWRAAVRATLPALGVTVTDGGAL